MRNNLSRSIITLVTAFSANISDLNLTVHAHETEAIERGTGFKYDYCSIGLSVDVYNDAQNYLIDVFNNFKIPMDPYTCPFHPGNLESMREEQNLGLWRKAKQIGKNDKVECPVCRKTFKTADYYEFHIK